ncbi:MAG TPA: glutaredoxin domain-containing protein [Solirubrobacteraceae bacterium]|nr:glutaredoxin domain-containing protein [Solirubrobacteraceae bacterium]
MPTHLELWQTEWCPASHRVRQRLTELGLSYTAHQVPVAREDRSEMEQMTGHRMIPVLCAAEQILAGEEAILAFLSGHFTENPGVADAHREKAIKAKTKELEEACPKLATAMR